MTSCVREILVIKPSALAKAKLFHAQGLFQFKTVIGIHIRRTDMLTKGSKEWGRIIASKQYVLKAISFFRKRFKNAHFIVCSDDLRWSRNTIKGSDVTFSSNEAAVDFAILTLCDHVIITVGSFGWWAGWFADGMLVYLRDYFRPGSEMDKWVSRENYFPPNWIGMDNK